MRRVRTALACAVALGLSAGPTYAQDDGVFVDPNSPSGREYAIPLESARRQADPRPVSPQSETRRQADPRPVSPQSEARRQADPRPVSPQSVSSGASRATLFGEGVISPSAARGARKGGGSATSRAGGSSAGQGTAPGTDRRPDVVKIATSRPGAPDSGFGIPVLVLGLGLLVLLVGAGAGFAVRRRAG